MSLHERLMEKAAAVRTEDRSREIFLAGFSDELAKLGYDVELLKRAGFFDGVANAGRKVVQGVGSIFKKTRPAVGPIEKKVDHLGAIRKMNREVAQAKAVPAPNLTATRKLAPSFPLVGSESNLVARLDAKRRRR
ncbi:MAG: hypothetical protein ABFE07_29120 [Armatimonadia bacterium]